MKIITTLLVPAALLLGACSSGSMASHGHLVPVATAKPDAAWLAKAKADYPFATCVVSGDKLGGSMGETMEYVYRQPGQTDRLVRFCCSDCPDQFVKDPTKYLKLLDAAPAKPAADHTHAEGTPEHTH